MKRQTKGYLMVAVAGILYCILAPFKKTTMAIAVTLLYTTPVFIVIIARIFYKESFAPFKTVAFLLCIEDCFFIATGGSMN